MVRSTRIMIQKNCLLLLICAACLVTPCHTSNILYFLSFGSTSHMNSVLPALEALSVRGHNVTFLTPFEPKSQTQGNVTVLSLPEVYKWLEAEHPDMLHVRGFNVTFMKHFMTTMVMRHCRALLNDPNFLKVAADKNTKYDVIIVDPLLAQCGLSLVWLLDSPPLIFYCTTTIYASTAISLGIPTPLSYVPLQFTPFTNEMTFTQRLTNLLLQMFTTGFLQYYMVPNIENLIREKYPELPSLLNIEKNVSFVFANSHSPSLDFGRPATTFFAEVGGIHCRPAKPLPKEMENFIQGAGEDGFIYFSLGTNIKSSNLPVEKMSSFISAFKRMKQRVIWKFEGELLNLPKNVRTFKWVPQQDVLGHSKIKAFITQGGQLSVQEAVYHSAPVVGIPFIGEQVTNIKNIVMKGMAEELDYENLSVETVYDTLMKIVSNSSYKDNCKYYSSLMQDRPMKAIDTIVYWVEYVIRHKGAHHLRPYTEHLNFFQYFLLDVIGVIVVAISLASFIIFKAVSYTIRFCCGSSKTSKIKLQ